MPSPIHTKQTETHAHCKQKDTYKPTHFVLLALGPGTSLCCLVLCSAELFSCKHTQKEHVFTFYYSQQCQNQPPPIVPGGPPVRRPCRLLDTGQNQLLCLERGPGSDLTLATANEKAALLRDRGERGLPSLSLHLYSPLNTGVRTPALPLQLH